MTAIQKMKFPYEIELSDKEWELIRARARRLFESKNYGTDHMKCYIYSFLIYIQQTESFYTGEAISSSIH